MKYNYKILTLIGLIALITNIVNFTTNTDGVEIVLNVLNIVMILCLLIVIHSFNKDTNMKNTEFNKRFYIFTLYIFIQKFIGSLSLPKLLETPITIIISILLIYSVVKLLKAKSNLKIY